METEPPPDFKPPLPIRNQLAIIPREPVTTPATRFHLRLRAAMSGV
jgi:hypothetical protein